MSYTAEEMMIKEIVIDAFKHIIKDKFSNHNFTATLKDKNDIVTDCDVEVERYIIDKISEAYPNDNFISEEVNSSNVMTQRTWIIDPIDGTVNFSKGAKLFGIQVALIDKNEAVLSCIYLPYFNELYTALQGKGAFLNGKKISVSKEDTLFHSLVTFGDFSSRSDDVRERQIKTMNVIYNKVRKVKMFGAACIDFAFLASGKTDVHIIYTKNLWDLIPGLFLAIEAGAISNYDLSNPNDFVVVANNERNYKEIIGLLKHEHIS